MTQDSPHRDLVAEALQPKSSRSHRSWRSFFVGVAIGFTAGAVCAAPVAVYLTVLLADL